MFVMRRSLRCALLCVLALAVGGSTSFGQSLLFFSSEQIVVASAEVSADGTTLFVTGVNFGRRPVVSLGGVLLHGVTVNRSGTLITAPMPDLQSGNHLLHIARGQGRPQSATFVVTVGTQGPKGDTGDKGDTGAPGAMGPKGDPGAKGEKGDRGDKGDSGSVGPRGETGAKGDKGDMGDRGPQGEPGAAGPAGTVTLANLSCGPGQQLRGFDANGAPVCTPTCGDGIMEGGEEFEGGPGPFSTAPVSETSCKFDFSSATQLFCNQTCSWGGINGCDVADATMLCRLKTGNPNAFALSFEVKAAAAAPGFACAPSGRGTVVPNMTGRTGGLPFPVRYDNESLLGSHGAGQVVTNVVCSQ